MQIHIALYRWKNSTSPDDVAKVLKGVEALTHKVPGVIDIVTGLNTSRYGEGYTHVILVRGETEAAIDAYRTHPDHAKVAALIENMEDRGIGIDFTAR